MEMKARLAKLGNDSQNTSDPKQFKAIKETNDLNVEDPSFSQHNTIKGESNEDVLQFPLGVRIKKEVLDPREEGSEEDDDDSDHVNMKPGRGGNKRTNVIGKLPQNVSNKSNEEEDKVEALKKAVADIPDVSQIWKVVRPKILSQCRIWDLLMEKVNLYFVVFIFKS